MALGAERAGHRPAPAEHHLRIVGELSGPEAERATGDVVVDRRVARRDLARGLELGRRSQRIPDRLAVQDLQSLFPRCRHCLLKPPKV